MRGLLGLGVLWALFPAPAEAGGCGWFGRCEKPPVRPYFEAEREPEKPRRRPPSPRPADATVDEQTPAERFIARGDETSCRSRKLIFSADYLPPVPGRNPSVIWGGNATGGGASLYSPAFLSRVKKAKENGHQTFAYLEGPCGNTGDKDPDGEVARCARIHNAYNRSNRNGNSGSQEARWEPFTFKQLTESGKHKIDHCEIDNLENNVTIPLMPFLDKYKRMYDAGQIHCKLVLKNIAAPRIDEIKRRYAGQKGGVNFISPFHIYEARHHGQRSRLNQAMRELKGPGAATIISTNTYKYGSAFTEEMIRTCDSGRSTMRQATQGASPTRAQRRPSSL